MIKIVLISGRFNDRNKMISLLAGQSDFQIVSTGDDAYHALKSAMSFRPDIMIMDCMMDDNTSGSELAPVIKRYSPSTSVIVVYSAEERAAAEKNFRTAVSGYLLRRDDFDDLVSSVRSVFYGGLYLSDSIRGDMMNRLLPSVPGRKPENRFPLNFCRASYALTPTEAHIFMGITLGHSDGEIAEDLHISVGGLRNCINHTKKKTGLRNRTQITVQAILSGMINIGKIDMRALKAA